ncbi:MAG: ATP-binding cassette domain-containing protein, partial [Clostridia bacterium]|nr:ATP-binding cassette domain-containing protein [Clostridia bacterium]
CTFPIMSYLSTDLFSDVGNTSEYSNDPQKLLNRVKHAFDTQIKRFLIVGVIVGICHFLSICFWTLIGSRMCHSLKRRYFTVILSQEQGWFDANNAFEFATKVQAQLEQVEMGIGEKFGQIITMISQCIIAFVFAFIISWKVTLVMLSIAPLIILDVLFLVNALKTGIIMGRKTWEKAGGLAEEMLYNIKTVTSFANFEYETRRFNEKVELVYQLDLGTVYRLAIAIGFLIFFLNCSFVIAICYGRTLIGKDINTNKGRDFTGADIMTASFCTLMGIMGIGLTAPNLKVVQESCTATSDYFTLYEREPQMDFSQSIERPPRESVMGRIEFRDVKFVYPSDPNERVILEHLNLMFEPGKKVALVGESGCGKSTTVNLIERLYEPVAGEILIDGMDIKRYDVKYLRSLIGYVQQEPVLFNKSIRENLIFGRGEYLSQLGNVDDMIQNACDEAYASEFISKLPDQLDYVVGIKGSKLSGGQKQRVAIARAILAKPKILILDEATSALDNKSEKEVQRALDNISQKNVTTVIIAHRLSTIKNADLIYAIKEGHVVEQGTHKELLERNGYYAGLVRSQLAQDEIETKEELEMEKKKSSLKRRNTDEEVQFQRKDSEIYIEEDTVKLNPCRVVREVTRDHCCVLILALIGAAGVGFSQPVNGLIMAHAMNGLNSMYETIRYDKGLKFGLIFLIIAFLQGLFNFLMIWMFTRIGVALARLYRKKVLRKYLQLHMSFYDITKNSPGSLLTRLSIDTMQLNNLVMSIVGSTVQCGCTFVLGLILGCIYEYRLTLIMFCFVPFIAIAIIIRRTLNRGSGKRGVKVNVEAGGILSECVTNTKTIYSFNFQQAAVDMYMGVLEYHRRQFLRDSIIAGIFVGVGQFCIFGGQTAVFAAAKHYILNGEIDSEDMGLALNIVMTSAGGIGNGLAQLGDLKKATVAFRSIYSTLDIPTLINPFKRDNAGKVSAQNIKGKIELRHVYFAYPTRPEQVILKDVSFTVYPGQQVALVGYSGSGKSTIIQLLTRFYDIEEGKGEILIDDVNIKDYNLYELRKKIGLVSQEPILFKRSVLENVRYGRLDATDEECIEAARQANIMKFFTKEKMNQVLDVGKKKDKGYATKKKSENAATEGGEQKVGAKEDPVSGGEKQRLAIARAFLKDPTILLLDEATSALDKDSEKLVQASLDKLSANRTSIAIAHRLSTIEGCDQIFVLENGRLVEQGTHEQLMALKNKYYTLHKYSDMG